jgi:hypothetical protein
VSGDRRDDSAPRRLELVLSSEHGLESEPPPPPSPPPESPPSPAPSRPESPSARLALPASSLLFDGAAARVVRSLAGWMGLTGLLTLAITAALLAQWWRGEGSVPGAVAAVLSAAIGLWSLIAAFHLGRALRHPARAQHELVSAFSSLRSTLILKAVMLFLALGLSCFTFSLLAALLASL